MRLCFKQTLPNVCVCVFVGTIAENYGYYQMNRVIAGDRFVVRRQQTIFSVCMQFLECVASA